MRFLTICAAALLALAAPAFAQDMKIERVTTLATPAPLPTAGVFMIITNNTGTDDKITAVKTGLTPSAALHTTGIDAKGVMSMRHVSHIAVPAGRMTALTPMGDHVMLMELKEQMKLGGKFPLTLTFEKAGEKTIDVDIVMPDELSRRFPPELMGSNLEKLRTTNQANTPDDQKSWGQRLRDRLRGKSAAEQPHDGAALSAPPRPVGETPNPVPPAGALPQQDLPPEGPLRFAPSEAPVETPAETPSETPAQTTPADHGDHSGH